MAQFDSGIEGEPPGLATSHAAQGATWNASDNRTYRHMIDVKALDDVGASNQDVHTMLHGVTFGDNTPLLCASNPPPDRDDRNHGQDRQENPLDRLDARERERLEGVACLIGYDLNTLMFSNNEGDRNEAARRIRNAVNQEYRRGGQEGVRNLSLVLRNYTDNGGAGGLVRFHGISTSFVRDDGRVENTPTYWSLAYSRQEDWNRRPAAIASQNLRIDRNP